jgi:hypothetical protein
MDPDVRRDDNQKESVNLDSFTNSQDEGFLNAINSISHPEEVAKRPSRRAHQASAPDISASPDSFPSGKAGALYCDKYNHKITQFMLHTSRQWWLRERTAAGVGAVERPFERGDPVGRRVGSMFQPRGEIPLQTRCRCSEPSIGLINPLLGWRQSRALAPPKSRTSILLSG